MRVRNCGLLRVLGFWSQQRRALRVFRAETRLTVYRALQCDTIGAKFFVFFGSLFGQNSRFINSFWLRLFVVRVLYHTQVSETTRHLGKFIGKMQAAVRSSTWAKLSGISRTFGVFEVFEIFRHRESCKFESNALKVPVWWCKLYNR